MEKEERIKELLKEAVEIRVSNMFGVVFGEDMRRLQEINEEIASLKSNPPHRIKE